MIYTKLTEKAMKIAFSAHVNQTDKAGLPYFHHPMHLAEQFNDEKLVATALLHDVVEDTQVTFDDLEKAEIPKDVIIALKLLTHDNHQDYNEYIKKIADNDIARKVKIADLQHNMDETRLREDNSVSPYDAAKIEKRREKYRNAYAFLKQYDAKTNKHNNKNRYKNIATREINNESCVNAHNDDQDDTNLDL